MRRKKTNSLAGEGIARETFLESLELWRRARLPPDQSQLVLTNLL